MDVLDLLEEAGLVGSLKSLGLTDTDIAGISSTIGEQLTDGAGMEALFKGLDVDEVLRQIDVGNLAAAVGISPSLAQSAVDLIAPKLAALLQDESAMGKLKSLAGKVFGR